ncbi:MAG: tetratricopeptide repeat protein [Candidatus Sumerlaeota bacterium]
MSDEFLPRPAVALFPFALGTNTSITARDADLCRGFANFIDRRLSQITGVEIVLQNLFVTPENQPAKRGWLMTNALWTYDQIMHLPNAAEGQFTHSLQGQLCWKDGQFDGTINLLDLFDGDVLLHESARGDAATALPEFFGLLGRAAQLITNSPSAGRIAARRPTASAEAFESYLFALASQHAFQHGMTTAEPAFAHFTKTLELDPDFYSASGDLETFANHCLSNGNAEAAAFNALEKITAASPSLYPRLSAMYALQLARMGRDTDRALAIMEAYIQAERHGSLASRAFLGMGEIHRQRNDLPRARASITAATVANPGNAAAWETLGQYHRDAGDAALAENCWKRALQEDPAHSTSLYLLAVSHAQRGEHAIALVFLTELFEQQEFPSSNARVLHAETLLKLGRTSDANIAATEFAEQNPKNSDAWFVLFDVRMELSDAAAAAYCIDRIGALTLQPRERERLQLCQLRLRAPLDFVAYQKWSAGAPNKDALEELARLVADHPDVIVLAELHANFLLASGAYSEALTPLRKIADYYPDDAAHLYALANAHEECGDLGSAIEAFSTCLQLERDNPAVNARLQRLIKLHQLQAEKIRLQKNHDPLAGKSPLYRHLYSAVIQFRSFFGH